MISRLPHRVAVLFSGRGVPGMNPFLNYFTLLGFNRHGVEALGIKNGFAGLLATARQIESGQSTVASCLEQIDTHPGHAGIHRAEQSVVRLDHESVSGLLSRGGIMLGATRCPEFHDPEARRQACSLLENLGVRALVVCGGDGSIAGASSLANESILRLVGVPASIENDVLTTETALGVDTALNTLTWAVEHVADTDVSHHRIMVFEVMGRRRGELARVAGLAAGAQIVVTPRRGPLTAEKIQAIAQRLEQGMLEGRRLSIVLVAEGVKLGQSLARHGESNPTMRLARELQVYFSLKNGLFPNLEARACILGQLQRGGSPSPADRDLAARFAEAAWQTISRRRERSGVLGVRHGAIVLQDFHARIDPEQLETAERIYRLHSDVSKR
jgi:6-phosphofructokinase 1